MVSGDLLWPGYCRGGGYVLGEGVWWLREFAGCGCVVV